MCDGETKERTLLIQLYSKVDVTFCVWSLTPLVDTYFLNSRDKLFGRSGQSNVYATRMPGAGQSRYLISLHIRNVTVSLYTAHSVLIHNDDDRQMTLRVILKRPGIHFTKQRTIGNIYVGQDVKLICERNSPVKKNLTIYKLQKAQKVPTSLENDKLVYEVASVSCQDMGRYVCTADDDTKSQDVEILNCPPVTCTNEKTQTTHTATVGSSVLVNLCAIAQPVLLSTIQLDDKVYDMEKNYSTISFNWTRDGLYNMIDIEFANITEDDFREHEASVATRVGSLGFVFRFQKREPVLFSLVNNSSLVCVSSQYPRLVTVYKYDKDQPIASISENSGIKESLVLSYELPPNDCSSLGIYECSSIRESGGMISRSQTFVNIHCPPVPCWNHLYTSTIEAEVTGSAVFNYCIIDAIGLQEVVLINGTAILTNAQIWNRSANLQVNLHRISPYNYFTIIFHNMKTDSQLATWYLTVMSNSSKKLDFIVNIKPKNDLTNSNTKLLAISSTLFILSTLFMTFSIWLTFFKDGGSLNSMDTLQRKRIGTIVSNKSLGKIKSFKMMPSSTRSSQVKLNLY